MNLNYPSLLNGFSKRVRKFIIAMKVIQELIME